VRGRRFSPSSVSSLALPFSLTSVLYLSPPPQKKIRSPGTIFGRVVRTARFSFDSNHGQLRSLRLRAQTPEGLAAAISRAEALAARAAGDSYFTVSGFGSMSTRSDDGDNLSSGPLEDEQVAAMA
jgi:hypothetical protein